MSALNRLHTPSFLWRSFFILFALLMPFHVFGVAQIESVHDQLPDYDSRAGQAVLPSGQALGTVASLGAVATWNQFGTPQTLLKYGSHLASASGDPVTAAKNWIRSNKALFRLSDAGVDSLELVNDSLMSGYNGHAVLFRQKFGALPSGVDGLITIGIARNKIYFVSSSAVGDQAPPGQATLSPELAWVNAATEGGKSVSISQLSNSRQENSWTVFDVSGWSYFQRSRLVAFPTPSNGVRPVFESNVVDFKDGILIGFTSFVDAQTGQVLARFNRVNQQTAPDSRTELFTGNYVPPACGALNGPFAAQAGDTRIDVVATSANPVNDIVVHLYYDHDNNPGTVPQLLQAQDLLTSPEHLMYQPGGNIAVTNYFVEICPFDPQNQSADSHAGTITFSKVSTAQFPYPPKWKNFPANPTLTLANTDTRKLWCWDMKDLNGQPVSGCDPVHASKPDLFNLAARAPWDHMFRLNAPSFTTAGNAAATSEAWFAAVGPPQVFGSPLALGPGPTGYMPHAGDRNYSEGSVTPLPTWTNQWQASKCSELSFTLAGNNNDRDAAAISLFTAHNRMHDWSYFLGFTERNYNLQEFNFGNTAPGPFPSGRESDPEFGFVQAGAVTGAFGPNPQTSGGGRNNANQLTLQDGVPGLTNMYLWQPNSGVSYAPCVDGDFDMSVIGHEYTHAISNRMAAGPDSGLTGAQSTAMGESWSDLTALEYLHEYGFVPTNDENPFAVGPYATGNKLRGIRNFPLNNSPLNYSNIGYDNNGVGPHQDGEIWSATNYDIRQLLMAKYNSTYPANNGTLQRKCADGLDTADHCPGNRRWIQIMFDAWLLMATGNVSMIDARNAYLTADMMRFSPANQTELWRAFAKRGLGKTASSNGAGDGDPIPSFETPNEPNATISFKVVSMDEAVSCGGCNDERSRKPLAAKIYVGRFEARSTALLTTIASHTTTPPSAKFVPGTYDFLVVTPGYGHFRFQRTFTANQVATIIPWVRRNWASSTDTGNGAATASGDGTNHGNLIDDTEGTQWTRTGALPTVAGSQVTVDLAGGAPLTFSRVQVSALLFGQARLSALRQFEIWTCTSSPTNSNCVNPLGFSKIYTSPADAFPGAEFRPVVPEMILRTFAVPSSQATHVQIRVLTNQCTGNTMYQGEQDNDPLTVTDCIAGSTRENEVTISELQVFSGAGGVGVPGDPVVTLEMTAPVTAPAGAYVTYDITYTNFGPEPSMNAKITDALSPDLIFVSADSGGTYNSSTRKVTWNLGTVPVTFTGTVRVTARINPAAVLGTVITNQAEFTGDLTVSPPTAAAVTLVMPEL